MVVDDGDLTNWNALMGTIVVFFCVRDDVKLLPQQRHSNKDFAGSMLMI